MKRLIGAIVATSLALVAYVAYASVTIVPSVGLYWFSTLNPSIAPGVSAPNGQLLIWTASPSVWYKSGSCNTCWSQVGNTGGVGGGQSVGPGMQGDGSIGSPIDIKHGTVATQVPVWSGSAWSDALLAVGNQVTIQQTTCGAGTSLTAIGADGSGTCSANVSSIAAGTSITAPTVAGVTTIGVNLPGASCAAGTQVSAINSAGTGTCSADVTAVAAGTGISASTSSGTATVTANLAGASCAAGTQVSAISSTGTGTCSADVTAVAAGTGISASTSSGTATVTANLAGASCSAGQAVTAISSTGTGTCSAVGGLSSTNDAITVSGTALTFAPTVSSGLQGIGTSGSPFDIKHGSAGPLPAAQIPLWDGTSWSIGNFASTQLPSGTAKAQTFEWDGSQWQLANYCSDPSLRWCLWDDFDSFDGTCGTRSHFSNSTGAGACTNISDSSTIGILNVNSNAGAGASFETSAIGAANGAPIMFGGLAFTCVMRLRYPILSTSSQEYESKYGFATFNNIAGDSTSEAMVTYDRANNGNVWGIWTRNNSGTKTETACNGSGGTVNKPVVANTWYTVQLDINAAATAASITVDGTLCATNTTGIPDTSHAVMPGGENRQTVGLASKDAQIDWILCYAAK